jgi:hypothetical protein
MKWWLAHVCDVTADSLLACTAFYLQWRYSMDTVFLTESAYPWISAVASHIEQLAVPAEARRQLPMSSSQIQRRVYQSMVS